jgi:hypothetical protein
MLHAQGIVYLLLKLDVRTDFVRRVRFHRRKYWRPSRRRYFAYAGFSSTTCEVIRNPSFEVGRSTIPEFFGGK